MSRNHVLSVPLAELPCVVVLEQQAPPFPWAALFGREAPVELEVGCGKGLFLVEAGRLRPHCNFLGVERAGKWFRRAALRVDRSGLPNIRVVQADALDLLSRWVPPASLSAAHVYFPDPWPKRRHAPRRLLQEPLYSLMARALSPGAFIFLATDVAPYFRQSVEEISRHPQLAPVPWSDDAADRLPTNYARKYALEGRTLHYAKFVKRLPPSWEAAEGAALREDRGSQVKEV